MGSNNKCIMVQDTNAIPNKPEDNRNLVSKENEKLQPEDNKPQRINANNNYTDIQGSAQDSNTRSIDESRMIQDSKLPENNNLNTERKTSIQNSNETVIDEYETVQDNSNLSPNNDGAND